jgi:acyl transferase domain-containing protein
MDPVRDEVLRSLADVRPREAALPLFSTVTGQPITGTELTADYWWQNVRQSVRFSDAMDRLMEKECNAVVEVAPHPVLAASITECFTARGKKVKVVPSLRRQEEERAAMLRSLGALHCLGRPVPWETVAGKGRLLRLPRYPWQRERFWHESRESSETRLGKPGHALLGPAQPTPTPSWESTLDCGLLPYLNDHKVQGHVVVPGVAYIEMALAAAKDLFATGPYVIEDPPSWPAPTATRP